MNLILLIGNVGSGKSTLARKLAKDGYLVVSRDSIRYSIRSGDYLYDPDLEPFIFRVEYFMFKELLNEGLDIVLDEVNVSKVMRKKYIGYAKLAGYKVIAIVMPKLSKTESVKRRLIHNHGNTNRNTWGEVWTNFNKRYVKPHKSEGFNKIINYKGDKDYGKIKKS